MSSLWPCNAGRTLIAPPVALAFDRPKAEGEVIR